MQQQTTMVTWLKTTAEWFETMIEGQDVIKQYLKYLYDLLVSSIILDTKGAEHINCLSYTPSMKFYVLFRPVIMLMKNN